MTQSARQLETRRESATTLNIARHLKLRQIQGYLTRSYRRVTRACWTRVPTEKSAHQYCIELFNRRLRARKLTPRPGNRWTENRSLSGKKNNLRHADLSPARLATHKTHLKLGTTFCSHAVVTASIYSQITKCYNFSGRPVKFKHRNIEASWTHTPHRFRPCPPSQQPTAALIPV